MANNNKKKSNIINLHTDFAGMGREQLSRDEIRSRKKRKLKRRRAIKKAIFSFLLLVLVGIIGTVLAFTVFFKIDTIKVAGTTVYPQKVVVKTSGVEVGESLLLTNSSAIAQNLMSSLPYIGSVSIERELPSTLIINVTDTFVAGAFMNKGTFVLINDSGKVLDDSADVLGEGIPVISGVEIKTVKSGETISFKNEDSGNILLELLKSITESGMIGVTEINLKDTSNITIKYDNRIKILFGSEVNLKTKVLRAAAAIERENEINKYEVGVLDLRTEPNAYFKTGEETTKKTDKNENNKNKTNKDTDEKIEKPTE